MLRRALTLFLVASIAACPFVCTLGGASAKAAGEASRGRCDCCHQEQSSDPLSPGDSRHCPTNSHECCQCICGGAILEVVDTPGCGVDTSLWAPLPSEGMQILTPTAANRHWCIEHVQPDDGSNVGRAMRCLFMSYLC
jgi:hypothetical protein